MNQTDTITNEKAQINTNPLRLTTCWVNLKMLITAAKKTDVKMHLKLLEGATFDSMRRPQYQSIVLNTAIDLFLLRPGLFGYSLNEIAMVTESIKISRPKVLQNLEAKLKGQYNENGTFFGEQPSFSWKRAPRPAEGNSNGFQTDKRPWLCKAELLPDYHIVGDGQVGGLYNHGWGFTNVGNEWYCMMLTEPKQISFAKIFEFGDDKEAKKHFERLFVKVIYGDKHQQFKEQILNTKGLMSLKM
jgi:hypothetical protein